MTAIATFTKDLSTRLLNLTNIERGPIAFIISSGVDCTSFFRDRKLDPSKTFKALVGTGYSTPNSLDIHALNTQIDDDRQAFGTIACLRKRRTDKTGNTSFYRSHDCKVSICQELDDMVNSVISEGGIIDFSQMSSSSKLVISLVASPGNGRKNNSFSTRFIEQVRKENKRLKFKELESRVEYDFLFQGIYGITN